MDIEKRGTNEALQPRAARTIWLVRYDQTTERLALKSYVS